MRLQCESRESPLVIEVQEHGGAFAMRTHLNVTLRMQLTAVLGGTDPIVMPTPAITCESSIMMFSEQVE